MITKSDFDRAEALGIISFTFSAHIQVEFAALERTYQANATALRAEADSLRAQRDALRDALNKIAYEPFGHADATHAEVLEAVTQCARAAIARATGQGE